MSGAGPGVYDAVELRRRIAVCFSVSELRALAESLGVGGITWERGVDEAAREVVKQCERYAGLPALVARLRELRPLVEWPEPVGGAAAEAPPAPPPAAVPLPPTLAVAAPPPLAPTPGTLGGAEPAAVPLHDPYAPPPGPAVIQAPGAPAVAPRASAPWPGTATPAAPTPSRGVDPRILVAVAGLMVLAAGLAFLAGRSSSPAAAATPAASASARPGGRPDGPAARAADALARSYDELARVCELPSSVGANELVFRRVFEHCGPSASPHHAAATSRTPTPEPSETAPSTEAPPPRAGTHPARGDAPSGGAPAAKGCMGQCDATHAACRGHCGPEPTESSAYDTYQHCLGRCLSEASHCRLGCR